MKHSRRKFLGLTTGGVALSAISGIPVVNSKPFAQWESADENSDKRIRIGIIGAENSHTVGFGRMFNTDRKFPGVEVLYVWGETEAFAENASEKGNIPNIVGHPSEMMGKIDALIVDHRHPRYHLEAAEPFVKAGIPTFVDKPFCYRSAEGRKFLKMAQEHGTSVTSYSSIAQSDSTFDLRQQVQQMGDIYQVVRTGPVDLDSKYGGVFFYGVHSVQPLMYIFGDDIRKVRITRHGSRSGANLVYGNGLFVTLVFKGVARGWETFVETKDGFIELHSRVEEGDPARNYTDMVEMFRTGIEPRSHESILRCVAVLEALEKSAAHGEWELVKIG